MTSLIQISTELNLAPNICIPCGGACCKMNPGITTPEQWGVSTEIRVDNLRSALASGRYAVDWWEGDTEPGGSLDEVYFVRPAVKGETNVFHGAGRNRVCTFFEQANGCTLPAAQRPDMCLAVVPAAIGKCDVTGPFTHENAKGDYAHHWRPYQAEILEATRLCGASPDDRETDPWQPYYFGLSGGLGGIS